MITLDPTKRMSVEAGRQLYDMIHPATEIKDYNVIGLESVPSEDFDFVSKEYHYEQPPMPVRVLTEHELWMYAEQAKSEQERLEDQMEYLRSKGIY